MINDFFKFGFSEEEYAKIIDFYLDNKKILKNNFNKNNIFFLSVGYSKEEIIKIINIVPILYAYDVKMLEKQFRIMHDLVNNIDDVRKITIVHPELYTYAKEILQMLIYQNKDEYLYEYQDYQLDSQTKIKNKC